MTMKRRAFSMDDFDAWMTEIYEHVKDIDGGRREANMQDMALGFLLARGVEYSVNDHRTLQMFAFADRDGIAEALKKE